MTYEVKRPGAQKDDQVGKSTGNPYDQVAQGGDGGGLSTSNVGMPLSGPTAPTATGYVNFDRLYNANAGVSQREAQQRQASAAQGTANARTGAQGLQNQFGTAVRTGSIQAPTAAQQDWAQYGSTNVNQPKRVTAARQGNARTGEQSYVTEEQEGLDSGGVTRDSAPSSETPRDGSQDANLEQQVRAGAAADGYTGPDALSGLDEYSKVLQDSTAAQDRVNNPTAGLGNLDAALIGGSGRSGFEQQKRDSGDLTGELARANAASVDAANAARESSSQAANAYDQLLSGYEGRVAGDKASAKATTAANAKVLDRAKADAEAEEQFHTYLHGGSDLDKFRNSLHTVGSALSPSEWVTGGKGLVTMGTNALSPMSSTNTGNVWGGWKDTDVDVWRTMTNSDWAEFAGLSDHEKNDWIAARRKKLKGGDD